MIRQKKLTHRKYCLLIKRGKVNKKNTESELTKNTVKENIFVNNSDSKTHLPLYVGGESPSIEIDIPITEEMETRYWRIISMKRNII